MRARQALPRSLRDYYSCIISKHVSGGEGIAGGDRSASRALMKIIDEECRRLGSHDRSGLLRKDPVGSNEILARADTSRGYLDFPVPFHRENIAAYRASPTGEFAIPRERDASVSINYIVMESCAALSLSLSALAIVTAGHDRSREKETHLGVGQSCWVDVPDELSLPIVN